MDVEVYIVELCCLLLFLVRKDLLWLHFIPGAVDCIPIPLPTTQDPLLSVLPNNTSLHNGTTTLAAFMKTKSTPLQSEAKTTATSTPAEHFSANPTSAHKLTYRGTKPVTKDENSTNPKGIRVFSSNGTFTMEQQQEQGSYKLQNKSITSVLDSVTSKPTHRTSTSRVKHHITLSAKNADHVPMWRKDALREAVNIGPSQRTYTVKPGPVFRPPSAISNKYGSKDFRVEPQYEDDEENNVRCWPECRNHTFSVPSRTKRKHNYKKKKFYNYKLLYDTLQAQKSSKKQKTEFYAWIFGATMLTLGSVTTLASCVVFCFCGDKLKRKKKKKKRRTKSVDDNCGEYQRVDSVSSMVSSRADTEIDKEEQENSELLDSVTII